jgi:hypothetical protein
MENNKKVDMTNWNNYFMSIGLGGASFIQVNELLQFIFLTLSIIGLTINIFKNKNDGNKNIFR